MSQLAEIFLHSPHAPYLLGSYGAALLVLVANVVSPLVRQRRLQREIRREINLRGPQS